MKPKKVERGTVCFCCGRNRRELDREKPRPHPQYSAHWIMIRWLRVGSGPMMVCSWCYEDTKRKPVSKMRGLPGWDKGDPLKKFLRMEKKALRDGYASVGWPEIKVLR